MSRRRKRQKVCREVGMLWVDRVERLRGRSQVNAIARLHVLGPGAGVQHQQHHASAVL